MRLVYLLMVLLFFIGCEGPLGGDDEEKNNDVRPKKNNQSEVDKKNNDENTLSKEGQNSNEKDIEIPPLEIPPLEIPPLEIPPLESPYALSLLDGIPSFGVNTSPVVRVEGTVIGDTVKLFTDDKCENEVGSAVSDNIFVNITASNLESDWNSDNEYTLYSKIIDDSGNQSLCSIASATYTVVRNTWVMQLVDPLFDDDAVGGDTLNDDICYAVTVDSVGNVYCAGSTTGDLGEAGGGGFTSLEPNADAFILKLNAKKELLWITQLGDISEHDISGGGFNADTSGDDGCLSISVDSSGSIYCAGYTSSSLSEDSLNKNSFIMKLNSESGEIEWVKEYFDKGCYYLTIGSDDNMYCAGYNPVGGHTYAVLMKIDSLGNVVWIRTNDDRSAKCNSIVIDNENGFIYCAGETSSKYEGFIWKLDTVLGDTEWEKYVDFDTDTDAYNRFHSIGIDGLGNIYGGGEEASNAVVIKYNTSGEESWRTIYEDNYNASDRCYSISVSPLGNIYCAGGRVWSLYNVRLFIFKLDSSDGSVMWDMYSEYNEYAVPTHYELYTGSTLYNAEDRGRSLAFDSVGNFYIGGSTTGSMSSSYGRYGGNQGAFSNSDAFIFKYRPNPND